MNAKLKAALYALCIVLGPLAAWGLTGLIMSTGYGGYIIGTGFLVGLICLLRKVFHELTKD